MLDVISGTCSNFKPVTSTGPCPALDRSELLLRPRYVVHVATTYMHIVTRRSGLRAVATAHTVSWWSRPPRSGDWVHLSVVSPGRRLPTVSTPTVPPMPPGYSSRTCAFQPPRRLRMRVAPAAAAANRGTTTRAA
eukprot:7391460-Prymnesium_polylepis.1